jgi:hypothetical protein
LFLCISEDEHALISRYCQSLGHLRREEGAISENGRAASGMSLSSEPGSAGGRVNHLPPSGGSARGTGGRPASNGGRGNGRGGHAPASSDIPSPTEILTNLENSHQVGSPFLSLKTFEMFLCGNLTNLKL